MTHPTWWTRLTFNRLTRLIRGGGLTTTESVLHQLLPWVPNSANWWRYPELTYRTINDYPHRVADVIRALAEVRGTPLAEIRTFKSQQFGHKDPKFTERLGAHLTDLGSDKATLHDYYRIYADLMINAGLDRPFTLLEIGLGSNDARMPSSMGPRGRPGASVRAFRDLSPSSQIYGADIDRKALFQETRLRTAWVDQMDPSSFSLMTDALGESAFDIIIDDGLHCITPNLGVLLFALNSLKPKGALVVEDVHKRALPHWMPIVLLLNRDFDCFFVQCRRNHVFVLRRR